MTDQNCLDQFRSDSGNESFRITPLTWVSLAILMVAYPAMSLLGGGSDSTELLRNMSEGMITFALITTVLLQWFIFTINYATVYMEGTGLTGLGLKRLRVVDLAWAVAFFASALLILSGLAWLMAQVGLEMPGELGFLIPKDASGRVLWVIVSITAGFCEEVAFRGYLMTRIRLVFKCSGWVVPT
ncbi:MAG: CPBP family glutamic-type intramembrane protease, partial [candidate division Zixibacteria bacterium]